MITTLWMFYPCFEWLFYTRAAAASTLFSPQSFSLCSVLVQLAIHFPKLLPKHIYICPAYVRCSCCTRGLLVKKCTRLHEHQFCPNCTSETEFMPKFVQVSHIFSFRCLPSDPPNCDTHSESKVDSLQICICPHTDISLKAGKLKRCENLGRRHISLPDPDL